MYTKAQKAPWLKKIEDARRGARFLMEKPSPLLDAMNEEHAKRAGDIPIWLGRGVGPDSRRLKEDPRDDHRLPYWG